MKKLILDLEKLKRGKVKNLVDTRISEFKKLGKKPGCEIFKELCFCLLTANYSAERGIEIQKKMGGGFLTLSEKRLASTLRTLGYRYPNVRAGYITQARIYKDSIRDYVRSWTPHIDDYASRDWVVKNIKGLGYKEASHFLRNIGYDNLAIIDFHIVDLLVRHGLCERPKTLTILNKIAEKSNLTLAKLDLYLWYIETGKVLK